MIEYFNSTSALSSTQESEPNDTRNTADSLEDSTSMYATIDSLNDMTSIPLLSLEQIQQIFLLEIFLLIVIMI